MLQMSRTSKQEQRVNSKNELFPMRGHIKCSHCGNKLTGSASSGNGGKYLYYHCNHCKKDRIRTDTAEKEYIRFLSSIKPNPAVKRLYEEILNDLSKEDQSKQQKDRLKVSDKIEILRKRIQKAQDLLLEGKITPDDYHKMNNRYKKDILELQQELNVGIGDPQRNKTNFFNGLSLLENLDIYFENSTLEQKQQILGSTFPEMMEFSNKKCRTNNANKFIELISRNNKAFEENKKGQDPKKMVLSRLVTPAGVEPTTFRTGI
ncbi:MAG: zinc ribbon domain-containing protein [Bacteroidales bacterium]|nr:zinc ribbon domain-containing protein [Bacteroidales bacterium]